MMQRLFDSLGLGRVRLLGALLVVLILLPLYYFAVLLPEAEIVRRNLVGIEADISSAEEEMKILKQNYQTFGQQKTRFDKAEKQGFFDVQSRLAVRQNFNLLKKESGVIKVNFEISPVKILEGGFEEGVNYKVLKSGIKINLEAIDDISLYRFFSLLDEKFPGLVSMEKLTLRKGRDINISVLRQVSEGQRLSLVSAEIEGEWQTLVPEEDVPDLLSTTRKVVTP